jgi:hypothetical protein
MAGFLLLFQENKHQDIEFITILLSGHIENLQIKKIYTKRKLNFV